MTRDFEDLSEAIAALRGGHDDAGLRRADLDPDPMVQFASWLEDALTAHPGWPNATALATADQEGRPSVRMVLLKGVDDRGFVFFTNYNSRKGTELAVNPHAALVFYWPNLERQVRVTGAVERISAGESDEYFASRPLSSRLGAWASEQSSVIPGRETLEEAAAAARDRYGEDIPRPQHWGGYRLLPREIEFFKSRKDRLHDRFLYRRDGDGWIVERLAP